MYFIDDKMSNVFRFTIQYSLQLLLFLNNWARKLSNEGNVAFPHMGGE